MKDLFHDISILIMMFIWNSRWYFVCIKAEKFLAKHWKIAKKKTKKKESYIQDI